MLGRQLKHGFRLIIHSKAGVFFFFFSSCLFVCSVVILSDIAGGARWTSVSVVINNEHRLHRRCAQVLWDICLHHLKIEKSVKDKSSRDYVISFDITFPASCVDDAIMLMLWGCDTTIVGVDCITWTRLLWLLSVKQHIRFKVHVKCHFHSPFMIASFPWFR